MRKVAIPALALALVLAISAVAHAVTNTYTVKGSTTSGTKKASKKKPVPVGISFRYTVGEQSGLRPSPVKRYSIAFAGLRVNTDAFPKCSGKKIDAAIKANKNVKSVCKKAVVGSGFVKNATGSSSNPADRSIKCDLDMLLINEGGNRFGIYLKGSPPQCAIDVNEVIHAKFKKVKGGTALVFDVKPLLLHPLTGLDNAVESVSSKIKKLKRTVKTKRGKKTVGFYEAVGGCKKGKRAVTVTFTGENGQVDKVTHQARCR